MKFVLATHGTNGDVQPLLALAKTLEQRGHSAVLAAPPNFARRVQELGVTFRALGPHVDQQQFRDAFAPLAEMHDPAAQAQSTVAMLEHGTAQSFEELREECRDADALVSFPFQIAGTMVRDALKLPFVSIHFSPFGATATNKHLAAATAPVINRIRATAGLAPLVDPLGTDGISDRLALFAVSPTVFRRPVRWPEHFRLTGYAFLDEPFEPDAALRDFMAAGTPPVVITFGSVIHQDQARVTDTIFDAIKLVGCRAIVQRGWSGLAARDGMPAGVIALDEVPHSWLFPQAACVVHAGGAGTTAAALRAGVPSLIVPHWLDQPLWALLVRELGCAETSLPFKDLTAPALADAIQRTLASERVRTKSADIGRRLREEQGTTTLATLLESTVSEPR